MKCEYCDNEATVRELTRKNGVRLERHLCERCAREQGITTGPSASLEELLKHFVAAPPATAGASPPVRPSPSPAAPVCPHCGLSFSDFKNSGNLGCAACYKAFETQLSALLERAQEGAVMHTGKTPRRLRAGGASVGQGPARPDAVQERTRLIAALRKRLDEALQGEQYEQAAKLRDEMRRIGEQGPGAPGPAPSAPGES